MSCTLHLLISRSDAFHSSHFLQQSLFLRSLSFRPRICRSLQESYRLLQLPAEEDSSPEQVKEAFLRLAKLYHPDSGAPTADAHVFSRVEKAYRAVLAHQSQTKHADRVKEEKDEGASRGGTLQHRHYLSYEGIGSGTPSQREHQYRQIRVDRASEQILNYRHKRAAAADGALVELDMRQQSQKIKITQAIERFVEDLIQESMARGDFRNLSGAGKPLNKFEHNPYADPMTHNLNRILIDNGYQPPWVVAQHDIRENIAQIRKRLLDGRESLGDSMTPKEHSQWNHLCASVEEELLKLNKMVDNYNLIVPMLNMQMVHFSLSREMGRAMKGAQQHKLEQRSKRAKEQERRIKERKRANALTDTKNTKQGLISWMHNLLR